MFLRAFGVCFWCVCVFPDGDDIVIVDNCW